MWYVFMQREKFIIKLSIHKGEYSWQMRVCSSNDFGVKAIQVVSSVPTESRSCRCAAQYQILRIFTGKGLAVGTGQHRQASSNVLWLVTPVPFVSIFAQWFFQDLSKVTACNRRDLASLAGLYTKAMFPYKFIENQGTEEKVVLNVGKCTSLKLREQEAAVITDCKHPPSCRNF